MSEIIWQNSSRKEYKCARCHKLFPTAVTIDGVTYCKSHEPQAFKDASLVTTAYDRIVELELALDLALKGMHHDNLD